MACVGAGKLSLAALWLWLPLRLLAACMRTANMHGAPRGFLSIAPLPLSLSGLSVT